MKQQQKNRNYCYASSIPLTATSPKTNEKNKQQIYLSRSVQQQLVILLILAPMICTANPVGFRRNNYPSIDLRLLDWPLAEKEMDTETTPYYTQLDCYTQLDQSFVDQDTLYRLNNSGQLHDRACMLRIPTSTRLTVERMHVSNGKSYVTVMAGSSQMFMPLRTRHIHANQPDMYGPWHVPCQQAYLVFRSKGAGLEWVEFRLGPDTEEDREAADNALCNSEGLNHAELEYAADSY